MKKIRIYSIIAVLSALTFMSFTSFERNTGDSGFYYCYVKGYYNGDSQSIGTVFSSVEEYSAKPDTDGDCWSKWAENHEKHFTARAHTYTLIGPFSFSHQAYKNQQDKVKTFKKMGHNVSEWNKGPCK